MKTQFKYLVSIFAKVFETYSEIEILDQSLEFFVVTRFSVFIAYITSLIFHSLETSLFWFLNQRKYKESVINIYPSHLL